jgi:hypothetical protein
MASPHAAYKPNAWDEIQLIEQIQRIIDAYNELVFNEEPGDKIEFLAAYPDYVFDKTGQATTNETPHKLICYDITKKESGSIGKNQFSNNKRHKVTEMENVDTVIEGVTKKQTISRKIYDVNYRFDCLTPSDLESMALIRDFERMMEIHGGYLERGCHRFIYNGRRPSYFNRDTHYKSRTCEFFAQVEEHWYSIEDRIDKINIEYLSVNPILIKGGLDNG